MEIERLELDGFGRFHDARWTLESGVTVFVGVNEAGKTTLLNALRAILFGFEQTRDGRTWYPPLAGGRRGGRMTLRLASGERWSVERHGERGGAGALAVRAPSGNQGGQETLDRLLHGADRDLFNNIFAFGLGELQSFSTLSTDGVRGRIYGASAGLGGTSAVDLERRLRQQMDALFLPRGREKPLNSLLARIEELRGEIADLARQPEEHAAAHRERHELTVAAEGLRVEARSARERLIRLQQLRAASPIAAELSGVEAELAESDPTVDGLPLDAVAVLDRRLASVSEARASVAAIDERIREATVQRAGLDPDEMVLALAPDLGRLLEERATHAGDASRLADLEAAEARHAAVMAEQLSRSGGWEEGRLLALDTSIVAVETIRELEQHLVAGRSAAATADQRTRAATDELASREQEGSTGEQPIGPDVASRADAVRRVDSLRMDEAVARARAQTGTRAVRPGPALAAGLAVAMVVAGILLGLAIGVPLIGGLIGSVAGLVTLVLSLVGSRPGAGPAEEMTRIAAERAELLSRLGEAPDASNDRISQLVEEMAAARARLTLAGEGRAALQARRTALDGLQRDAARAQEALEQADGAWSSWLSAAGLPHELSPEAARQVLAAAATARHAAVERDQQRTLIARQRAEAESLATRADALLGSLGNEAPVDQPRREALLSSAAERLQRAREAQRRTKELDALLAQLAARLEPAATELVERHRAVDEHLASVGCADADQLRAREAAAAARRSLQTRVRELRARLAVIAGEDAVGHLLGSVRATPPAAVEAEEPEAQAELERIESEERDAVSRMGALDARIRQLEAAGEIGARRQSLAVLEGQAAAMARSWAVRAVALRLFEETRSRYERERQPDVLRSAEDHFERITGGRYSRIVAPPGDGSVRVETEGGESRVTDELSRGTAEQLYLALRFGLIEEFARQAEPLPVVMDDILVNFDPERAARAAAAIRNLATRHQVLYFTCHQWTAELVDPGGTRTITLS